jgi:protein-S-isoprenylcysteine O-methyltransferase Ste14
MTTRARAAGVALAAWSGGAAFAAVLLYAAWWYAVELGNPDAPGSSIPWSLAIDAALFGVFALHHSVFARPAVKRWVADRTSPALERPLYVWIASLLLALTCAVWQPLPGALYRQTGLWVWLHAGIQAAGLLLVVHTARSLGMLELAGVRSPRESASLQTGGAYRLIRHPLYLGWVLMTCGAGHMTTNRLVFAVVSCAYLVAATPVEERALRAAHGEAYRAYEGRVRWRILPGIY